VREPSLRGSKLAPVAVESAPGFDQADPDDRPNVAEALEPERVAELQRSGEAHLIDVRQIEEWRRGRIAGAVHIVLEEVTERAAEVPHDRAVVFACRGGSRSAMVADAFRGDGYDAYNMAGGLRAWEQAGLPLEGDEGTVG
jgi:rhodanese-related sulfurtransferase